MSKPKRITVYRWREFPGWFPDAVYIGRANSRHGLRASKWANPYRISATVTREEAVARYVLLKLSAPRDYVELHRKTLVCWCEDDELCHGDFLWDMAHKADAAARLGILSCDVAQHWEAWARDILKNVDPGAKSCGIVEKTGE